MASYSDLGQIAQQSDFRNRVRYALYVAAINAYSEDGGTTGHAARAAFAIKVLSGQYDIASVTSGVLTNPTISSEANANGQNGNSIPDGDLQFALNSIYNGLAGV